VTGDLTSTHAARRATRHKKNDNMLKSKRESESFSRILLPFPTNHHRIADQIRALRSGMSAQSFFGMQVPESADTPARHDNDP
jgi:hypothetical protein